MTGSENRQALSDGTWFDRDAAQCWAEDRWHDGQNWISRATGSQWVHEALYRTRSDRYIVHRWSQWQGSHETWEKIDRAAATRWLVRNGHAYPRTAEL